jgi:hypothetical protein
MPSDPYRRFSPTLDFSDLYSISVKWGGWGSNPRPADYEKSGPMHRTPWLHGYHGAVPLTALIALYARVTRSTNRSTTTTASALASTTERHHVPCEIGLKWSVYW